MENIYYWEENKIFTQNSIAQDKNQYEMLTKILKYLF